MMLFALLFAVLALVRSNIIGGVGDNTEFENPCTAENLNGNNLFHPYPFNASKYIQCDFHGNAYIMSCPARTVWSQTLKACDWPSAALTPTPTPASAQGNLTTTTTSSSASTGLPFSTELSAARRDDSPCVGGQLYHPYPGNKFRFIQCDVFGHWWVRTCAPGTQWSGVNTTCIHTITTTPRPN